MVYVLKNAEDSELWNVGIKKENTFVNDRVKNVSPGTIIGFLFKEEIPAKVKGYSPAKSIVPYVGGVDPDYDVSDPDDAELNAAFNS